MNPLTNVKNITKLNKREIELGISDKSSWHQQYKNSAYVFIGGLPYDLTEGDIITVFSQYGEIVNINLVRDKQTGKSKGFAFLCYEDQRSTNLAVDNFNGTKLLGRILRVDHVHDYKQPKEDKDLDDVTKSLREEGVAPKPIPLNLQLAEPESDKGKKKKKAKKEKKKKKKHSKLRSSSHSGSSSDEGNANVHKQFKQETKSSIKVEKHDSGYLKYSDKVKREEDFGGSSGGHRSTRTNTRHRSTSKSADDNDDYDRKERDVRKQTNSHRLSTKTDDKYYRSGNNKDTGMRSHDAVRKTHSSRSYNSDRRDKSKSPLRHRMPRSRSRSPHQRHGHHQRDKR